MNIQKMLKQAQQMQEKLTEAQSKMEEEETEGSSGGGLVTVRMTGKGTAKKISIDDSLIKVEDKEMLEDLIIAAVNDAKQKADAQMSDAMSDITSGMAMPPGMKLPF